MRTRRTAVVHGALTLAGLLVLTAGCGGAGGGSGDSGPESGTLTVWMMTGGPGDSEIIEQAKAAFAKKQPGIDVKVEIQQWDSIATKITTALASGKGPDVVEMGNTQTPLQSYSGALLDLTADKAGFEESATWLDGLAQPSTHQGKLYATPLYGGTKVVLYNKDLFAEAGIDEPPATIEELKSACETLAEKNSATKNFSGFYMPGQYWFAGAPFVFGKGGDVATRDGDTWKGAMSTPQAQEGLREWKDFQNTCSTPSSVGSNTNSPDQTQLFADEQTAMLYVRAWEPDKVLEKNPKLKDKLGYFVMPGYEKGKPLPTIVAGSTIGVSAATTRPNAAKDWLRVVTGREFQGLMAQKLNLMPISPAFMPADGVTEALTTGAEAVRSNHALPVTPGQATLDGERYNEQFFSDIAAGKDIAARAAEYDAHIAKAFNATGTTS
ncbi:MULTISPECIES: extracellular solute-binding protein [Nonomuraea]|uniref:extracellular solute-binding protein n=1 Tax=Nonomuraea TaxID=83681 RepID=UPI001C5EEF28|nr:extracellular solute-binding protein [Nonomuraea ceibae]